MTKDPDFLYELLPVVHRLRDADRGYPLRALLRVIGEQAAVLEKDIAGLYENWFIETCEDWVVPYIGALIGYTPGLAAGGAADAACGCGCGSASCACATPARPLVSMRREVANTIGYRRRKGTLAVLDDIALAVGGWPAHAVESRRRLAVTQNIDLLHLDRGRSVDVRHDADWRGAAFDRRARTVDVRRVDSSRTPGRDNLPEVGVYVWRLGAYTVSRAPALCFDRESAKCFLFSALGNDTALVVAPHAAGVDPALPLPIGRRALETSDLGAAAAPPSAPHQPAVPAFYGESNSFMIWTGDPPVPVEASRIVAADLGDWVYRPKALQVAVDPQRGRIVFPAGELKRQPVWVSYAYAFSADFGGGEYSRSLDELPAAKRYTVGSGGDFPRIGDALARWKAEAAVDAVIEIVDSGVYTEPIFIALAAGQSLQLRAANRRRPVLRLLDWNVGGGDRLEITGEGPCWFQLDGIVITGRGLLLSGSVSGVTIRHSTLVPGWGLDCACGPTRSDEPSIDITESVRCVRVVHSIVGAIRVERDEVREDPLKLSIDASVVDALGSDRLALATEDKRCAHAVVELRCSTVIGQVQTHRIELAVDCILDGLVRVCRRQAGCLRFCYVTPGSTTPRRYECQPDGVERVVGERYLAGDISAAERDTLVRSERLRVTPEFDSLRYGTARYARLADTCAAEIRTGADDQSEIGVLHHLHEPQRAANLAQRLAEFTPAGTDAAIIYAS